MCRIKMYDQKKHKSWHKVNAIEVFRTLPYLESDKTTILIDLGL